VAPSHSSKQEPVVVIDDSDITRELVRRSLEDAGYRVVALESAVGSTSVIFREEPDLVLLDVNMPTLSGERLAEILRGNARLAHCRILLYSGASQEELSKLVRATGADGYISKSLDTDALVQQIRRSLSDTGPRAGGGRGRGKSLVVDDSNIALEAVRLSLEPAGFQVLMTTDTRAVPQQVLDEAPDAVLVDMNMLDLPGEELAELVKRICRTPGTRVLLHSSEQLATLERAAERCGADGYVCKTSDPEVLVRQIVRWLG
jgi:CheY-like chemotaxis protein